MLCRLVFCLSLLCATTVPAHALQPVRVADGVYAFIGETGDIEPRNEGNVGNSGFIVGSTGVVVIDTGTSYRHGLAMIAAIRAVTPKQVELVIITHAAQEFLFGAAAFAELGTPVLMHVKSAELMRQRCDHCLNNLRKLFGEDAMAGTRLIEPQRTLQDAGELDVAGHTLRLLYFGWSSAPGALAVFDQNSGVLFTGGLATSGRIPELRDGKLDGWLAALDQLARLPVRAVVPGYGPPDAGDAIAATATYLRALDDKVQTLYRSGASLLDAVDNAGIVNFSSWSMYPALHRQNALHRYLQLELQELGG